MGKKDCWKCEICGMEVTDTFPETWWHIKHLLLGKGVYMEEKDFIKYKNFGNLTFCSVNCFATFLYQTFGIQVPMDANNPSRR